MIKIIGANSGNVYAEGYREDCFRELQEKYPDSKRVNPTSPYSYIYPEPLFIVKGGDKDE